MGLFDLFKPSPSDPHVRFWTWFQTNEERLSDLFDPLDLHKPVYAELSKEIKRIHEAIMPELYKDVDGKKVLVISADGEREAVEAVIGLSDAAPDVPGWRVERFRKPAPEGMLINYQGLEIDPGAIRIAYKMDKERKLIHLGIVIPGHHENDKRFIGVAFLYLDHTIGEYNTIMHTGRIDLFAPEQVPANAHLISLVELRQMIETEFY